MKTKRIKGVEEGSRQVLEIHFVTTVHTHYDHVSKAGKFKTGQLAEVHISSATTFSRQVCVW